MDYLRDAQAPLPPEMVMAAVVVLTRDLETELNAPPEAPLSPRTVTLVEELRSWGREVRADRFEPLLRRRLEAGRSGRVAPRGAPPATGHPAPTTAGRGRPRGARQGTPPPRGPSGTQER